MEDDELNPEFPELSEASTPFEIPQEEIDLIGTELEDGSMEFGPPEDPMDEEPEFDANLAEYIDDSELTLMAAELVDHYEADVKSRSDWAESYIKGLDLLGFKIEERTEPWAGASGVFHPLLTEAVVRFQAQAMSELFPASGPAACKIMGRVSQEAMDQAERVKNELNYQLTERMTEYRDETESMLFRLALAGSAFKKIYYSPISERPTSAFVPVEDFVVAWNAADLDTSERYTHVMKKTANEILQLQVSGFYRDVDLPTPQMELSDIEEKYKELEGKEATISNDDRHTILEMHVDINMPEELDDADGIARPHIVSIDKSSGIVLSIRRNWEEEDPKKQKLMHFAHYKYLPGLGIYGIGLIHLIGGLAKSASSLLRQLIDAGTLSNLPGGLKARGMRIKGDDTPIMPGEFRDVDVPGGTIRDSISFLPYKEPSMVLYQLLGTVVDEGRRIGSIADVEVGNMGSEAPVGTTLALMERSLKVMSGVQARIHAAMRRELRIIGRVIHDYMPPEYDYEIGDPEAGETHSRVDDFDGRVDIIPVSDPNAATMAQRVVQYQSALQLAQQAPQLYDMGKLHRQMLNVLGIQDAEDIIKLPDDIKAADPVTENMSILKQEPTKVFPYQDHEAHIAVHKAMADDPKIKEMVGQSPFASAIMNSMASHITEHVAMQYRVSIQKELGVDMPDVSVELPEEAEVELSRMTALAADQLLRKSQMEAAAAEAEKQAKDPLTEIQRKELEIKEREVALKEQQALAENEINKQKVELATAKELASAALDRDKLQLDTAQRLTSAVMQEGTQAEKASLDAVKLVADMLKYTDKTERDSEMETVKVITDAVKYADGAIRKDRPKDG